jgi:hypothetical protein
MPENQIAILISLILGIPSLVLSIIATKAQVGARKDAQQEFKKSDVSGISVQEEYLGLFDDGLLLDFHPDADISYYETTSRIAHLRPFLRVTVANQSRMETLILAPFMVCDLVNVIKIPDNSICFYPIKEGIGGGGSPDYFECILSPKQNNYFPMPCLDNESTGKLKYEYFDLKPLETEVFEVNFQIEPGYLYRYRIGIAYKEKSIDKIFWIEKTFQNGVANNPQYYKIKGTSNQNPWKQSKKLEKSSQDEVHLFGINSDLDLLRREIDIFRKILSKQMQTFKFPASKKVEIVEDAVWNQRMLGKQ